MDDLTRRAHAAYFRTGSPDVLEQPEGGSALATYQGRQYVVLRNVNGPLAVYRVRTSGALKRLRRWPAELAS